MLNNKGLISFLIIIIVSNKILRIVQLFVDVRLENHNSITGKASIGHKAHNLRAAIFSPTVFMALVTHSHNYLVITLDCSRSAIFNRFGVSKDNNKAVT